MKPYLFYALLIVAIAPQALAQGRFPLQPGNLWEFWYLYPGGPPPSYAGTARATGDTVMPNGVQYSIYQYSGRRYFREVGTRVYEYNPYIQREMILCDFSAAVGDTIGIRFHETGDTSFVLLQYSNIGVHFGRSLLAQSYQERFPLLINFNEYDIVDSIGFSYFGSFPDEEQYGLWGAVIDGHTYGTVDVEEDNSFPRGLALFQNYPNPFNPSTKIGFRVSGSGDGYVSLKVYDLLGREVATLVNEKLNPGSYERTFSGEGLSSGLYFYRLQAGEFTETRKLLLLK